MKQIKTILIIFLLAFLTSLLLDWSWINTNFVRTFLVDLLILIELTIGFFYLKTTIKK